MPRSKSGSTKSKPFIKNMLETDVVLDLVVELSELPKKCIETTSVLELELPEKVEQMFHDIQFRGNFMDIINYDMSNGEYTFGKIVEGYSAPLNMLDFAAFHGANEIAIYLIEQSRLKPTQQTLDIVKARINPNKTLHDLIEYFLRHGEVAPRDLPDPTDDVQLISSSVDVSSAPVTVSDPVWVSTVPNQSLEQTSFSNELDLITNLDELSKMFPNPIRALEYGDVSILQSYFRQNPRGNPTYWDGFLQRRVNLLERALTGHVHNEPIVDYLVNVQGYPLEYQMLNDAVFYARTWAIAKLLQYPDIAEYASYDNNALLKHIRTSCYSNADEMAALFLALPNVAAMEAAEQQVVYEDFPKKRGLIEQGGPDQRKYRKMEPLIDEEIELPNHTFVPMAEGMRDQQFGGYLQPGCLTPVKSDSESKPESPKAEETSSSWTCRIM